MARQCMTEKINILIIYLSNPEIHNSQFSIISINVMNSSN